MRINILGKIIILQQLLDNILSHPSIGVGGRISYVGTRIFTFCVVDRLPLRFVKSILPLNFQNQILLVA